MGALATYHFGHLPVWVDGNAYFTGATVSKHELHGFTCPDAVQLSLEEREDGSCVFRTDLYERLKGFRDGLIHSDLLGCAFEPEQRFESPDGSAILFDSDYAGDHRGVDTLPGPFAAAVSEKRVW